MASCLYECLNEWMTMVILSKKSNHVRLSSHDLTGGGKMLLVLLGRGKPPPGPSVTISCWGAFHDGLNTYIHADTLTVPRAVRAWISCMPHATFQSLRQEWSEWTSTKLSLIFSFCQWTGSCAGGHNLLSQHGESEAGLQTSRRSNQWAASENLGICWPREESVGRSSKRQVQEFSHSVSQNAINSLSRLNSFHLLKRH